MSAAHLHAVEPVIDAKRIDAGKPTTGHNVPIMVSMVPYEATAKEPVIRVVDRNPQSIPAFGWQWKPSTLAGNAAVSLGPRAPPRIARSMTLPPALPDG
jgi:hypothetical protein